MEGYYWRLVDPAGGRVLVALCGACRTGGRRWAVLALAAHPGRRLAHGVHEAPLLDPRRMAVSVGEALAGSTRSLRVSTAADLWVDVAIEAPAEAGPRALGALGPAHLVPWLPQYWHPVTMGARAYGWASLGDGKVRVDGWHAYLEKNWGHGFAREWWWGQASAFGEGEAEVAFAGGPVGFGPLAVPMTAVVIRLDRRRVSLAPPLAAVTARVGDREWIVRARRPGWDVRIDADAAGREPHVLPVPDVRSGGVEARSHQHLAGRLALEVRRRGQRVFRGESDLAGLERDVTPALPGAPPP
jgi:tocopherol cyclase